MKRGLSTTALRAGQRGIHDQINESVLLELQSALLTAGSHQLSLSTPQERSVLYQTINYIGMFKPAAYLSMYDHPDLHVVPNLYNPRSSAEAIIASLDEMEVVCIDLCTVTYDFLDKIAEAHDVLINQIHRCSYVTVEYIH